VGHSVVCISRQDGAEAEQVALRVAGALGFRLIDEDIVARAATEAGVDHEVVADVERRKSALVRLIESMGAAAAGPGYMTPVGAAQEQAASDALRDLIRSVIEDIAAEGGAVIVAHAASLALAGREDVLRVLVTASPATRAQRIASALSIGAGEAARECKRSDAARADYLKRFYNVGAELPTHYDIVVNTDRIAPADAAAMIVATAGGQRAAAS
jgi:cytidylate kinase